jgi:hypothetical protein
MIGWRSKPQAAEEEKPKGFDDFDLRLGDLMRGERATLGKSLLDVQRELKIKATYIAAIENADVRPLRPPVSSRAMCGPMRAIWAWTRTGPFAASARRRISPWRMACRRAASPQRLAQARARAEFADPLANPNATFVPRGESCVRRIEPGAVGSMAVLVALIGAIGYGGWSVLQEVQRVQLAPVDEAPAVVAQIDPLAGRCRPRRWRRRKPQPKRPRPSAAPDLMDRLYRPQALDVPVMVARDGPIAAIDPRVPADGRATGPMPRSRAPLPPRRPATRAGHGRCPKPGVEVLAVRPSWVRVTSADGTVLFEKILDAGERYACRSWKGREAAHRQFRLGLFRGQRHDLWSRLPRAPMWSRTWRFRPRR